MRTVVFILFSLLCLPAFSQHPRRENVSLGAFGGFGFEYMEIRNSESLETGFHGGIVLNRWLASGIYINGLFTLDPIEDRRTSRDAHILGGHGGVFVAPVIFSNALVHASFPVCGGYGGINYELYDAVNLTNYIESNHRFWMFKPGIEAELNVLSFVRVAIGGYYRMTSKLRLQYADDPEGEPILPEHALNGWSFGIKLRFGKF